MSNFLAIRRGGSFLERKASSQRMRDRDTAGGRIKPHSKPTKKRKVVTIFKKLSTTFKKIDEH